MADDDPHRPEPTASERADWHERPAPQLDRKMLELLVCPLTKQPLRYDRERGELISSAARLAFPVREGVAILLPSEARSLDQ